MDPSLSFRDQILFISLDAVRRVSNVNSAIVFVKDMRKRPRAWPPMLTNGGDGDIFSRKTRLA